MKETQMEPSTNFTEDQVRQRAFELWRKRGAQKATRWNFGAKPSVS